MRRSRSNSIRLEIMKEIVMEKVRMGNIIDMLVTGTGDVFLRDLTGLSPAEGKELLDLVEVLKTLVPPKYLETNMTVVHIEELKPITQRMSQLLSKNMNNQTLKGLTGAEM